MGKKKKAKQAEQRAGEQGPGEHGPKQGREHGQAFQVPPQIAGIAAMLAGQVASPAGRKLIANALNAAAGAIAGRDGVRAAVPVPPAQPALPVHPEPPVAPGPQAAHTPGFETSNFTLPPEATRAIGAAASALERWAQRQGKPRPPVG